MKRSEMIDKIMEVIDGDDSYPLARSILAKIEQLGMLPPSTDWLVNNQPDRMTWETAHDYHLWEPE